MLGRWQLSRDRPFRGHQLSGGGWSLFPVQEIRPAKFICPNSVGYKDRGDTMIAVRRGVWRDNPTMKTRPPAADLDQVSATSSFPYSVTVVTPVHLETETFQVVRLNRIGSHFP